MSTTDPTTNDATADATNSATTAPAADAGDGIGAGEDYPVPDWLSLDPDEEIVWVGEPVMMSLVGTVVWGVVLIPFLIGILILLALPLSYLSLKNTDFVVTTKSLYVKKGIASTSIETVDIDKIQNTEYNQSFWGNQFDYANIDVSTAGSSGAEITFQSISNARAVRERISELGNRAGRDSGGRGDESGETDRAGDDRLDELVAELRATREAMERIEAKLGDGSGASAGRRAGTGGGGREGTSGGRREGTGDAGRGGTGQPSDRPDDVTGDGRRE